MSRDIHARRSGCFVSFWVAFLLLATVLESGLIWWMNPGWFDRLAFWRGEIYPPETVVLPPGPDDDLPPVSAAGYQPPEFGYWTEGRVSDTYRPDRGLALKTLTGTEVDIPPGAITEATEVSLTPVVHVPERLSAGGHLPVGPLYDLRVGDAEHWRFNQPVRFSIPFDFDDTTRAPADARRAIGVWDGNRWEVLPTSEDTANGRLIARTDHASLIGVLTIIGVTAGGSAIKFTEPGRAVWKLLTENLEHTYKSDNFAIHYNRGAPAGVPDDIAYLLSQRRSTQAHPLYVMDMAKYLEDARQNLPQVDMKVAAVTLIRYDVFLVAMNNFGSSELGGPVLLDNDFSFNGSAVSTHLEYQMRVTGAHELIHVAQDDYFNISNAGGYRWWLELTAEYLSHRLMKKLGRANPEADYYIRSEPELLATPINRAEQEQPYAYAHFFNWLEGKGVDVQAVILQVNKSGAPDLTELNTAVFAHGGTTLTQLFPEYARDFHHRNLWTGAVIPAAALQEHLRSTRNAFTILTRQPPGQNVARLYVHGQTDVPLPPLAARHFLFRSDGLPTRRGAKLVLHFSAGQGMGELRAEAAGFRAAGEPLFSGQPVALKSIALDTVPESSHLIPLVDPAGKAADLNQVSLLVMNPAAGGAEPRLTVRRWLLLAPASVTSERRTDGSYKVTWPEAELKADGGDAFKGYNIYRRRWSDANFPKQPLNAQPVTSEEYIDQPSAGAFYAYTVTVVDRMDNESEPAPLDESEPFEGIWEGKFSLTRGEVSDVVIRVIRNELFKSVKPEDQSMVDSYLDKARVILQNFDVLLRIGIPLTIEISKQGGRYKFLPLTVFGKKVEDPEPLMMQRAGLHSLAFIPDKPGGRPFILSLKRKDEIDRTFELVENDPEIGRVELAVRLALTRNNPPTQ